MLQVALVTGCTDKVVPQVRQVCSRARSRAPHKVSQTLSLHRKQAFLTFKVCSLDKRQEGFGVASKQVHGGTLHCEPELTLFLQRHCIQTYLFTGSALRARTNSGQLNVHSCVLSETSSTRQRSSRLFPRMSLADTESLADRVNTTRLRLGTWLEVTASCLNLLSKKRVCDKKSRPAKPSLM